MVKYCPKKEKSKIENYRNGTGGGPQPKPLSSSIEKVLELFADSPAFNASKELKQHNEPPRGKTTQYNPDGLSKLY